MLDRGHRFVLRRSGAADGDEGFAGRVRHQMEVEIVAVHGVPRGQDAVNHL